MSTPPHSDLAPGAERREAPRPTLLVFTLGAAGERARRPLLPGAHGRAELELRHGLLESALDAGREAGCRLRVSMPAAARTKADLAADVHHLPQEGESFGERLELACRAARAEPAHRDPGSPDERDTAEPLLVVGADVPGLAGRHLRAALDALAADPEAVVLGPSPDGGFYLLATTRPLPGLAGLTRWCRPDTLARLRRSLRGLGRRVVLLQPLADLDRRHDLERWLAGAARRAPSHAPGRTGPDGGAPAAGLRALWRSLLRLLARLLADLRRPPTRRSPRHLRPTLVPVRSPRPPPRRL